MRKRINKGYLKNGIYYKEVSFSKAVLWMTKELSLRTGIMWSLKANNIKKLVFIDKKKKEKWSFKREDIEKEGSLKMFGQEEQWYFPIHLATKSKLSDLDDTT